MSFVETINAAQNDFVEDPTVPMDNMSAVFGAQPSPVKGKKKPMGQGVNCTGHTKVFLLWRPWTACSRCIRDIEHGSILLPDDSDHTCPHVQSEKFEEILNKCLSGDFLIQTQEYFTLQDGTRCVHMVWLELNSDGQRALLRKETAKIFSPMHSELFEERAAEDAQLKEDSQMGEMEEYEEPPGTGNQKEAPEASDDVPRD
jgi:hypothetical protein